MPAQSIKQRRLMAIAEHNPSQLYARNQGVAKMSHKSLHDFASTKEKGLPERTEEAGERKMSPAAERKEEAREHSGPTKVVARLFNRKRKR